MDLYTATPKDSFRKEFLIKCHALNHYYIEEEKKGVIPKREIKQMKMHIEYIIKRLRKI